MTKQSRSVKYTAIIGAAILLFNLLLACPVRADDLTVTKEIVVDSNSNNNSITITRTSDDGLLITTTEARAAGDDGLLVAKPAHKALVLRTDHEGNIKWRYETGLLDPPWTVAAPEYHGAVVMPDGSSFECGEMPRQDAGFRPDIGGHSHILGLLTHLDRDGNAIGEQVFSPKNNTTGFGVNRFLACDRLGNGIVIVGTTMRLIPKHADSGGAPVDTENLYWLVAFDTSGKMIWEKLQPIANALFVFTPDYISPLQMMLDGGFVFAAAQDQMGSNATEVVHIGPSGDVVSRIRMDGLLTIAPQKKEHNQVALVSLGTVGPTTSLIVLDDQLHELHRNSVKRHRSFETAAFLLSDQTLILFGSKPEEGPLFSMKASVAKVDAVSGNENDLLFVNDKANSNWIKDATAMAAPGAFAAVRIVEPTDLVLDFIHVK